MILGFKFVNSQAGRLQKSGRSGSLDQLGIMRHQSHEAFINNSHQFCQVRTFLTTNMI